jgi:hypothetical protein
MDFQVEYFQIISVSQLDSSSVSNHELMYLSTLSLTEIPDDIKHSGKSIDC